MKITEIGWFSLSITSNLRLFWYNLYFFLVVVVFFFLTCALFKPIRGEIKTNTLFVWLKVDSGFSIEYY